MTIITTVKDLFRPARDIIFSLGGFSYDFYRFFRYGGWQGFSEQHKREFKAVKIYHRIEKSLSYKFRDKKAGYGAARDLVRFFQKNGVTCNRSGFHEQIGLKVLRDFLAASDLNPSDREYLENFLKQYPADVQSGPGGVKDLSASELLTGRLEDPERFFLTRHSVRDFKANDVPAELINRALQLAQQTPSVCNRQAWHVYHLDSRETITRALALQNGNRGFGHEIPCLLILTADLKAFDTAGERYQHWIDGGMFAMSLVMALHALGLATCCLNWSKGIVDDLKFRRRIAIAPEHTILMMLAVGYANDELKVCYSARRPTQAIYTHLD